MTVRMEQRNGLCPYCSALFSGMRIEGRKFDKKIGRDSLFGIHEQWFPRFCVFFFCKGGLSWKEVSHLIFHGDVIYIHLTHCLEDHIDKTDRKVVKIVSLPLASTTTDFSSSSRIPLHLCSLFVLAPIIQVGKPWWRLEFRETLSLRSVTSSVGRGFSLTVYSSTLNQNPSELGLWQHRFQIQSSQYGFISESLHVIVEVFFQLVTADCWSE